MVRRLVKLVLLAGLAWALSSCGQSPPRTRTHATAGTTSPALPAVPVELDPASSLLESVHAGIECEQCHAPALTTPGSRGRAQCAGCHPTEVNDYQQSIHGRWLERGRSQAPDCPDCHGRHEIRKHTDPAALTSQRLLPLTCGRCHAPVSSQPAAIAGAESVRQYYQDAHGHALLSAGLLVAPNCNDCHGSSHRLQWLGDPSSPVARPNLPKTCGACHTKSLELYRAGVHGDPLAGPNRNAPICTDCHGAHRVAALDAAFLPVSTELCGRCHIKQLEQYHATYHGKALLLGVPGVATCFDCHGAHAVFGVHDARSSVAVAQRPRTCLKCHPSASAGFAEILAHGTPDDRQAYPQLYWLDRGITWALLALLSAMSVHSLLWLVRGLWELRWTGRSPEHGLAAVAQQDGEAPVPGRDWLRFPALERFAHGLVAVSFFLLTLTGMPLKFRDADWAKALFSSMGGVPVAGGLHRLGAALLLIGLGLHVLDSLRRIRRYRRECRDASGRLDGVRLRQRLWGPDSIWPQRSDWRDLRLHLRWFVRGGSKPGFDRFAYWEKFHHLVVALSLVILLLTGILLWFPQTLTKLVPGWLINVAQVVHSDQALLMAGLVLVFHAFHVALRPDRFPLNPAMFTGQVTEEQLRVERPRHYARLVANGDLESSLAGYSWQDWRPILASLGLVALIIGLLLAVAIFAGLGQILLG